jgi:phosphoribosylformimino-5-aminoimidazole carboxamide ribotide isomerase
VIVFPAIDLKDGRCVRLRQGDMAQATVFNDDPVAQARAFEAAGFEWLHLVDLNGAFAGRSINAFAIRDIIAAIKIPLQLGGGIRDLEAIEHWLDAGAARVILGTVAVTNPTLVREAARAHPGRIAVGIDAREGKVAVKGWAEESSVSALKLAKEFEGAGVAAIIFTDIARDGTMEGANVQLTSELARSVSVPVIASGGVNSVQDIVRLKECGAPIAGVVIGRALYDGRVSAVNALQVAKAKA